MVGVTPLRRPVEVSVEATFALRQQLLRADRPDLDLRMPDDDAVGAFHLAVLHDDGAAGVITLTPSAPEFDARAPAYRIRQMAVAQDRQGDGIGALLFAAAVARLRAQGVATLWAESRNTSLGFYLAHGMRVVPGRQHAVGDVAYTDVTMDLTNRA
jgi:GNAT superfamily N-acetyltransferase